VSVSLASRLSAWGLSQMPEMVVCSRALASNAWGDVYRAMTCRRGWGAHMDRLWTGRDLGWHI
jgi:hypothetical protein